MTLTDKTVILDVGRLAELLRDNPIAAVIIGCEIGFWVILALGLGLRYLAKASRLSTIVLWCVPLVDVVLLVAVGIDLRGGATATAVHGLAAIYLGVSVAFGHRMVTWADGWIAYRFAGRQRPTRPAKGTPERLTLEWKDFGRLLIAAAITVAVVALLRYVIATPEQTAALVGRLPTLGIVIVIWLVTGPLWEQFSTPVDRKVQTLTQPQRDPQDLESGSTTTDPVDSTSDQNSARRPGR